MEELDFEEGKERIIDVIERAKSEVILVGFYGYPNSGKSYLINQIGEYFDERGLEAGRMGGSPRESIFEEIRDNPKRVCPLLLFHYGADRVILPETKKVVPSRDEPQYLAERFLGRGLDLSVKVYNPNFYKKDLEEYDILISNPDSVRKKPLK